MYPSLPFSCIGNICNINSSDTGVYVLFSRYGIKIEKNEQSTNLLIEAPQDSIIYHNYTENNQTESNSSNNTSSNNTSSISLNVPSNTLSVSIFLHNKKLSSNVTNKQLNNTNTEIDRNTTYEINIQNTCYYNINVFMKGDTSISKKLKKQSNLLSQIIKYDDGTLYMLQNNLFVYINHNGFFYYYPDNLNDLDITDLKLLDSLQDITEFINHDIYKLSATSTLINISNNSNISSNNIINSKSETTGVISTISSIIGTGLSWVNPFSYMQKKSSTDEAFSLNNSINVETANKSVILSQTNHTNQTNHTTQSSQYQYYFNNSTCEITKLNTLNNKIKILLPTKCNLPVFIDTIHYDENTGVKLCGLINTNLKPVCLEFNKFFLNDKFTIL